MLKIGDTAPEFALPNQNRQTVKLSEFRGQKNVVIAFHPLAFTPVCSTQMTNYQKSISDFDDLDAHILSISCDPGPSKKAWGDSLGLTFDLLADFHPKGAVASAYGVMREDGIPERAIFVIDKKGTIVWAAKYDIPQQPPQDELLKVLKAL